MAHRSFTLTLPGTPAWSNLYTLMLAVPGAVPVDGILPKLVSELEIQADKGNASKTVTLGDGNNANTSGRVLQASDIESRGKSGGMNRIHLPDYWIKGSTGSEVIEVDIDFR